VIDQRDFAIASSPANFTDGNPSRGGGAGEKCWLAQFRPDIRASATKALIDWLGAGRGHRQDRDAAVMDGSG
jgi:hypothetical protein